MVDWPYYFPQHHISGKYFQYLRSMLTRRIRSYGNVPRGTKLSCFTSSKWNTVIARITFHVEHIHFSTLLHPFPALQIFIPSATFTY